MFRVSLFTIYARLYRVMIALENPSIPWSYLLTNYPFAMQIRILLGIPIKLRFLLYLPQNSLSLVHRDRLLLAPFLPPNSSKVPRHTFVCSIHPVLLLLLELPHNFGIYRCENLNLFVFFSSFPTRPQNEKLWLRSRTLK